MTTIFERLFGRFRKKAVKAPAKLLVGVEYRNVVGAEYQSVTSRDPFAKSWTATIVELRDGYVKYRIDNGPLLWSVSEDHFRNVYEVKQ